MDRKLGAAISILIFVSISFVPVISANSQNDDSLHLFIESVGFNKISSHTLDITPFQLTEIKELLDRQIGLLSTANSDSELIIILADILDTLESYGLVTDGIVKELTNTFQKCSSVSTQLEIPSSNSIPNIFSFMLLHSIGGVGDIGLIFYFGAAIAIVAGVLFALRYMILSFVLIGFVQGILIPINSLIPIRILNRLEKHGVADLWTFGLRGLQHIEMEKGDQLDVYGFTGLKIVIFGKDIYHIREAYYIGFAAASILDTSPP